MKSTIPKVSVIVPVYNAGERFIKCMDTLVNQSLRDIEIILVLDCPTDGTDTIAKEYAAKDNRIVIIENKTNLHIGYSRNEGIKVARGEYIGFSDHDDYRELTMYEELYKVAEKEKSDIVLGTNFYFEKFITTTPFPENIKNDELKEFVLKDLILDGDEKYVIPIATNIHPNIYKTSFIKEKNLLFVDTQKYSPEDRIFQIMCLVSAQNVSLVTTKYYYHIMHSNSAVHSLQYKSCATRAFGKQVIYDYLNKTNCYEKYKDSFLTSVKKEFTECLLSTYATDKSITNYFKNRTFLKTFSFCENAFRNSAYSLKKFRLGGRLMRIVTFCLMKM